MEEVNFPPANTAHVTSTDIEPSLGPKKSDPIGDAGANDETRAPEEEAQSEIPGDPRPPHQTQPPTKEQY